MKGQMIAQYETEPPDSKPGSGGLVKQYRTPRSRAVSSHAPSADAGSVEGGSVEGGPTEGGPVEGGPVEGGSDAALKKE
jgi:hypothetical protein